ncbi:MAG: glycosyltransferase involved in cell wall biosynthesis [Desulforhopalus sp.]|jgi:glycosyltransferase involved in cell wall biosynthesis
MKPQVSVVITCYNYGKYLAGCVESVLCQTYQNIEIIIIDDGSTDNSNEVVQEYLSNPLIKYIRQENAGQANAKNAGIQAATGDFIAFLDADDLWESTKLEKQMPMFSETTVGVVYSRARFIDEEGRGLDLKVEGKYLKPRSGRVTEFLFFDNFVPFSSAVLRRECVEKVGEFDESLLMGIDWDLWLRISTRYLFVQVDEPLLIYRVGHPGQMSKNVEERQRCSDRIMMKFMRDHPDVLSKRAIRSAQAYTYRNRAGYFSNSDIKRSNEYYLLSLKGGFFNFAAYRGLLVNFLKLVKLYL